MVKPRENRVPIMMSDEELTAIDDWRFDNRVATRSDAVRRLVQIGLRFDKRGPGLLELVFNALFEVEDALSAGQEAGRKALDEKTVDAIITTLRVMLKGTDRSVARQMEVVDEYIALISEITQFKTISEFDAAIKKANEVQERQLGRSTETAKMIDELKQKHWP